MGYCWWCGKWSQVHNALCLECRNRHTRKSNGEPRAAGAGMSNS
jgi:hypothetical protein